MTALLTSRFIWFQAPAGDGTMIDGILDPREVAAARRQNGQVIITLKSGGNLEAAGALGEAFWKVLIENANQGVM